MKELLAYLLNEITGKNPEISESTEDGKVIFTIKADSENIGLIIGKGGQTIKALQAIVKIKARLENKYCTVNVVEI